jgi:hypothetical protein
MGTKPSLTDIAKAAGYGGTFDDELDCEVSAPMIDVAATVTRADVENIWRTGERDQSKDGHALFV